MPTYSKLQKLYQDSSIGFRTVNQASDNEHATRDAYDAEHVVPLNLATPANDGRGRHDHLTIPKDLVLVTIETVSNFGTGTTFVITPVMTLNSQRLVQQVIRLDVGTYAVICSNVHPSTAWAEVHPVHTSSSEIRMGKASQQKSSGLFLGFYVIMYERNSGSGEMEPADMDFVFALFSR
jgi:hypothetical protein